MPGSDFAQINISLAAAAAPRPSFGVSLLLTNLTSLQYQQFITQSGGGAVLELTPAGWQETLEALGISAAENTYADVFAHFSGQRVPERMYMSYRGEAALVNLLTVSVRPQADNPAYAAVGQYRVNAEGGPYIYDSPGVAQVVDITIEDTGGGNGDPGIYRVEDESGAVYTYESGGKNLWTITVVTPEPGLHVVTIDGVAYSYTAGAGETAENIRDGLYADMADTVAHPGGHPNWIQNNPGTNQITAEGANVGYAFTAAITTEPNAGNLTAIETTPIAPETVADIATNWAAAIAGSTTPPAPTEWSASPSGAVITITAANPGVDLGISSNGPNAGSTTQALTTDHRETVIVVRNAINAAIGAGTHPSFTNAPDGDNRVFLDGQVAGDVLEVSTATQGATIEDADLVLSERQSVLQQAVAQVSRVKIIPQPASTDAFEGTYTLTLFGETLQHIVGVGSGESVTDVRDSLQTQVDTLVSEVTTSLVGGDAFDLANNTAGEAFQIGFSAPNSNQAMEVTVQQEVYGIAQDIQRASDQELGWYQLLNGDHTDLGIRVAAEQIEVNVPKKLHGWQTADDAVLEPLQGATDIGAVLVDLSRLRSWGVYHPSPVNDLVVYEAPFSQWAAVVLTKEPGQVSWHGRPLTGFTGNIITASQNSNLKAREMSFLEAFRAARRDVMNGGFTSGGRIIDVVRAMDQLESELTIELQDLMQLNDILPYTPEGISQVARVINEVADRLAEQGSVVENSLEFPNGLPKISDANQFERERGIMPEFVFKVVVQAGTTRVTVTGTVTQ